MLRQGLVIFVLACGLSAVFAINCYSCDSNFDQARTPCLDPMSPYPSVNITLCFPSNVCTRISYVTNNEVVVSRSCYPAVDTCNQLNRTVSSWYPDISNFTCYTCDKDFCNDASASYRATRLEHRGKN